MQEALRDEVGAASLKNCAGKDEATTMKNRALNLISPVAFLVIWELLVALGALDRRFFPAPSETLARLLELLQNGELTTATVITLRRMAVGFVLAAVPAVVIGLLMGANRMARIILGPLITALYPVPKIALVPMVVILLGIGETSKVAIVAISVFFLVVIHTMAGVLNVEQRYFDIARNNGARPWDLLTTVAIPASLPNILTGINLALGFALTVIVGTELLLPQGGLGADLEELQRLRHPHDLRRPDRRRPARLGLHRDHGRGKSGNCCPGAWQMPRRRRRLQDEPRLRRFVRTWWLAVRPFSFTASVTPVVLGSVLAAYDGAWSWLLFAITLVGSVSIHAGTNLINDFYDWKKGTDTPESLGPNRALKEGILTPQQVFWGGVFFFALGSGLGLYLVATAACSSSTWASSACWQVGSTRQAPPPSPTSAWARSSSSSSWDR